jgi:hypothetical protein
MESKQNDVLNRLDALLNKDKADRQTKPDAVIPLLTEVYTPQETTTNQQLLEELLPGLVNELEDVMRQAIIELRPKTEALLRQHLQRMLAQKKS